MKAYIQVVDTRTGIYQCGMIEEPVKKGFEIQNALGHFGIKMSEIDTEFIKEGIVYGKVIETTKKFVVILE